MHALSRRGAGWISVEGRCRVCRSQLWRTGRHAQRLAARALQADTSDAAGGYRVFLVRDSWAATGPSAVCVGSHHAFAMPVLALRLWATPCIRGAHARARRDELPCAPPLVDRRCRRRRPCGCVVDGGPSRVALRRALPSFTIARVAHGHQHFAEMGCVERLGLAQGLNGGRAIARLLQHICGTC